MSPLSNLQAYTGESGDETGAEPQFRLKTNW